MILNKKQTKLYDVVIKFHGDQKRKYTGEPYHNHPHRVAKKISHLSNEDNMLIEIALCHDLIEDTSITYNSLMEHLAEINYSEEQCYTAIKGVRALTNKYTHQAYPTLNRRERNILEGYRLLDTSPEVQIIKCADILDNVPSIYENNLVFGRKYAKEKQVFVSQLTDTLDSEIYLEVTTLLNSRI